MVLAFGYENIMQNRGRSLERQMKVAVIHDWLVVVAGAEKVLGEILELFPQAELYCLLDFLPTKERGIIGYRKTTTSFIQNLPFAKTRYRRYLPLMPLAIEQFDLTSYDLVISSTSAVAKGVITGPDQLHISYVHSPMRYAWDLQFQYLQQTGLEHGIKGWLTRWMLHKIRIWDTSTAHRVDHFIANSNFIAKRIKKVYGRYSVVIHPPIDTDFFTPSDEPKEDFYLTVSRLVPYKRIEILVKAFAKLPESRLVIIGNGPELEHLQQEAGKNVEILGYQNNETVKRYLQKARAFLFAAQEDFGIVPLEAQACGTPVIAYGRGGALETVQVYKSVNEAPPTGLFFTQQTPEAVINAITNFEANKPQFTAKACRNNALRFKSEIFKENLKNFLGTKDQNLEAFLAETREKLADNDKAAPLPTIHAVIVDYFKANKVAENLRTLAKQYPHDKISISIVDNSCDPQNTEILNRLSCNSELNLIVNDTNTGYVAACNQGARNQNAKYILLLNPDITWPDEPSLTKLVEFMQSSPKVAICGPQQINPDGQIAETMRHAPGILELASRRVGWLKSITSKTNQKIFSQQTPISNHNQAVDWLQSSCLLVRNSFWQETGGLDKNYFLFMGDLDFCRKAWRSGQQVWYVTDSVAHADGIRASAGGIAEIFRKPALRSHVRDAIKYFYTYFRKPWP